VPAAAARCLPSAAVLHRSAALDVRIVVRRRRSLQHDEGMRMEYRHLGRSGLKVSVLSFGVATFGGGNEFFSAWGNSDVAEATRLVSVCFDAGVNLFDTANVYSRGLSEEILGKALGNRRQQALISTKVTFPMGDGPNDVGSSRYHVLRQCEASLRRLGTDYIDIYHLHGFDAGTPIEETLHTLETLVSSGKVRYIACSNFSGWHLMKSLGISEKYGWARYVAHQVYYSLIGRDFEWELMPLGIDQGVGSLVWSPLGWGRLTGKIRRNQPLPAVSRLHKTAEQAPPVSDEYLYRVVDALDLIAKETGKSVPQIALNWLLQRPTISTVIIGARNEEQLRQNLAATGWNLTPAQVQKLDEASTPPVAYPYWHQRQFGDLNPAAV
jgi:aryl-alcohol dehydrogenase-like predicted oxidoreductase